MNRTEAEEHLRVIRSLMEKATIYRAISAPTAMVGGVASIVVGLALHYCFYFGVFGRSEEAVLFFGGWGLVLAISGIANALFIRREASRRGEPFISAGMKKALAALFPPLLCGACATVAVGQYGFQFVAPCWMVFYGLGLLATTHFAPRSIPSLGWAFVAAAFASIWVLEGVRFMNPSSTWEANVLMLCTFGLFHLVYALCTWPRKEAAKL